MTDAAHPAPPKQPTIKDVDSFVAVSMLSAFGPGPRPKNPARAYIDPQGDFWICDSDESNARRIKRAEALALTQFLVEHFDIRVLNEPESWGNEPQSCECKNVPDRVECSECGDTLCTANAFGQPTPWERDEAMTLF